MNDTGIIFEKDFMDADLIDELANNVNWVNKTHRRRECFMADQTLSYNYDGKNTYYSIPFHSMVKIIMQNINHQYNCNLDICFLNMYDDQFQGLGWHADDSHEIDQSQPIAVVSYGATRDIWVKPKNLKGEIPNDWKFPLNNGSLFIMPSGFQDEWLHKIPKHPEPCGPRISLTFRKYKS